MIRPKGFVIYDGPSVIDGEPIVVISTMRTKNAKTGDMIQTWIMRKDVPPTEAVETGDDSSVCGDCRHRGRTCYVRVCFAPRLIWDAYKRGNYPMLRKPDVRHFMGVSLRLGSYGDPAALPYEYWLPVLQLCRSWTGYTHLWKNCDPRFKRIIMASVDTPAEYRMAQKRRWRTFRVRMDYQSVYKGEIVCPASAEAGKTSTCEQCGACSGTVTGRQRSVAIIAHGGPIALGILRKAMRGRAR